MELKEGDIITITELFVKGEYGDRRNAQVGSRSIILNGRSLCLAFEETFKPDYVTKEGVWDLSLSPPFPFRNSTCSLVLSQHSQSSMHLKISNEAGDRLFEEDGVAFKFRSSYDEQDRLLAVTIQVKDVVFEKERKQLITCTIIKGGALIKFDAENEDSQKSEVRTC